MTGALRQEPIFAPLPDFCFDYDSNPDDKPMPHPDGRAWLKACGECACRPGGAMLLDKVERNDILEGAPGMHFYCLHRQDGGFNRICACYAAAQAAIAKRIAP